MPQRLSLAAEPRTVLGKKVRRLRREGLIPANLVEAGRPSIAMQVPERALADLVRAQTSGQLVDLESSGARAPVLLDAVDIDTLTNRLVHVTLRKVDLTKSIHVMVRVALEGYAPASDDVEMLVLQHLQEIEVSALPTEIPTSLTTDVSALADIGDEILVRDLRAADGSFEPVTDPGEIVIQVMPARAVEEEEVEEELDEALLEEGAVPEDGESEAAAETTPPGTEAGNEADRWQTGARR